MRIAAKCCNYTAIMQNAAKVEIFQRWNTIYVQSRYNNKVKEKNRRKEENPHARSSYYI